MDLKKIGKFIAENRKKAGFSQESLAEELDISSRSVSKMGTRHLPARNHQDAGALQTIQYHY